MNPPTSLQNQIAVVTGGARGIGLAISQRLSREGCRVVIWDRDTSAFDATAAGFSPLLLQQVDITDLGAVERAAKDLVATAGRIEVLVNNAGINGPIAPSWEYPIDAWHSVLAVDLTGTFHVCRAVIPQMRTQGYGRIINIASIVGKEGNANSSAYSAAKGGVIAFTKAIAKELAGSGVLANCVAPAITETDLLLEMTPEYVEFIKAKIPLGRFGHVDEIAAMTAWIAKPECSFTTGFVFDVSGGRATY
ncbi:MULTISPECIES: SDR family NAD(P)-dependent oxidoreductase [unclassified Variovorax]|uniref:SDR family NAD(P)-dependent oxidoreductase n=1 Tax=unclassified Variovorax TaxID=663243 RepID=UPI0008D59668|nr:MULTISPECIES: SDR family NAD(P)-dependent oxidoreductase [unclassified Variovorax]SEK17343.1 3-oxoacyl-[acyl-carrier protein] reductase [Variovorax sp. OK202]SFE80344.1 3-oxoacyl-[acyl-carrier protein] reductase [Variovorax sp. OK212]